MRDIGEVVLKVVSDDLEAGTRLTDENLLLTRIGSGPVRILFKRIAVKVTPHVAAAAWELVVTPSDRKHPFWKAKDMTCHVPPNPPLLSMIMKFCSECWLRRRIAIHMPGKDGY